MKIIAIVCALALLGFTSGCGSHREALVTGKLKTGTFWKNSLAGSSPSNEGGGYAEGSRVEIYNGFLVVTTPDGLSHIHPHGFYSNFSIQKE